MKYTIKNYLDITYEDLNNHSKASKLNSHAYLIDQIYKAYEAKGQSKNEAHKLKRKIVDLKELREVADYDNIVMTPDNSNDAYELSVKLIQELKQTFKI